MCAPRGTSLRSRAPAAFLEEAQLPTGSVAADAPSVRVKVVPAPPPDPVLKGRIGEVEQKRADAEAQMFEQATAEMKDLTQVVLSELENQLQLSVNTLLGRVRAAAKPGAASASFLGGAARQSPEGLPKQLNVRVGAADVAFPTISSLVQDMESRRDASSSLSSSAVRCSISSSCFEPRSASFSDSSRRQFSIWRSRSSSARATREARSALFMP